MPGPDPTHWLHRFTADEWLRAAENELQRARQAFVGKQHKTGVAGARRAAGMALNATLTLAPDDSYGRSYMDHLHALVDDSSAPEPVRLAARELVGARLTTELVPLGPGDTRLADVAQTIVAHAKERVHPSTSA